MEKQAITRFPVHELIKNRWSPRAFTKDLPSWEDLGSMLEAARWAPSCFNGQPWRFIIGRKDRENLYGKILFCLREKNQLWAKQAPVLGILVIRQDFEYNGKPNRWANFDGGLAMAQFIMQAEALGWSAHVMAGLHRDKAREAFSIPENFEPHVAFAVGKVGDPDTLPEDFPEQERQERERKPLEDIVFSGTWEEPADWLSR
jgi:nitroreductase